LAKASNDAAYRFFTVGMESTEDKMKKIQKEIFNMEPTKKLITDLYYGLKDWGVF
jgi:electron transfer flavoprotein-quinone oxidoreductase